MLFKPSLGHNGFTKLQKPLTVVPGPWYLVNFYM